MLHTKRIASKSVPLQFHSYTCQPWGPHCRASESLAETVKGQGLPGQQLPEPRNMPKHIQKYIENMTKHQTSRRIHVFYLHSHVLEKTSLNWTATPTRPGTVLFPVPRSKSHLRVISRAARCAALENLSHLFLYIYVHVLYMLLFFMVFRSLPIVWHGNHCQGAGRSDSPSNCDLRDTSNSPASWGVAKHLQRQEEMNIFWCHPSTFSGVNKNDTLLWV